MLGLDLVWLMMMMLVSDAEPHQPPKNIFILSGQSNMAGRGGVTNQTHTNLPIWDGVVPPQSQSNPSILRLNAKLNWVRAHEPLHADIDVNKTNGIGPGMPFAKTILTKHPTFGSIGLVPCAIGGTNITQWKKGGFHYNQMMLRTRQAASGGGVIRALLWFQGESDTVDRHDADSYKERSEKFFFDLRSDLQLPLLPIIQVGLASGEGPYVDLVRRAQLDYDILNVRKVDAKGLPLEPDGLHLTTPAQVRLGKMMADAFLQSIPITIKTGPTYSHAAPAELSNFSLFLMILSLLFALYDINVS